MRLLVTGGAGFIGSAFLRTIPLEWEVVNFDTLSYAGHLRRDREGRQPVDFIGDLQDEDAVRRVFQQYGPFDVVVHLAAESSVDLSIREPAQFFKTNVVGTVNLLNACRRWRPNLFINVVTDEVFGHLDEEEVAHGGAFNEQSAIEPRNPYSASKAGQFHAAEAFATTFNVPVTHVFPSNCYGPGQHAEKLIPRAILSCMLNKPLPLYNEGRNVRQWLHVNDLAQLLTGLAIRGPAGERFCAGGNETETVRKIVEMVGHFCAKRGVCTQIQAEFLPPRPGDDHAYTVDSSKVETMFGWKPTTNLVTGLESTVEWYLAQDRRVLLAQLTDARGWF